MSIDTSIYQILQPPRIQNPMEAITQVLQGQKVASELRGLRQQQADEAAIRQILAGTGGNIEEALPQLRKIAPAAALKFETELGVQRKNQFDALRSQTELEGKRLDIGLRYLQGVRDDKTFQIARRVIHGMEPQVAEMLGDTYDPAIVAQVGEIGLSAKEHNDAKRQALELFTKGEAAKAVGTWLSTVKTEDEWNGTLQTAEGLGVPPSLLQQFGTFSPENVKRAGLLTMTPKEREAPAGRVPTIGSFEDYVQRYATGQGKTPETLTPADIEDARKRYQQADDRPITVNTGGQRPITQTAEAGLITRLNSQWTKATAPKRELAGQVTTMRAGMAAAERGDLAQGTEAVLQPFLKILDDRSVVRESEFWRLQEGQALLARAQGIVQRLTKGGFVPLSELKKYAQLAEEIATRYDGYVRGERTRIGKVADRYGIPQELVFETEAPPTDDRTTTTAPAPTPGTGPKIGERRTINGQLAEWKTINGQSGWVAVR